MNEWRTLTACLVAAVSTLGCDSGSSPKGSTTATPTSSATAKPSGATTAAATGTAAAGDAEKLCADLGGKGPGTFGDPCKIPWAKAAPIAIRDVGIKKDFDKEVRMCELTNNSDRDLTWGSISSWYYDKSGKVLEVAPKGQTTKYKSYNHNGSTFQIKKGEKKEFSCGWAKEDEPKDATIEFEMTGWGWGEEKAGDQLFVSRDSEGKTMDERPLGGFK
jgi:hypothetical protein